MGWLSIYSRLPSDLASQRGMDPFSFLFCWIRSDPEVARSKWSFVSLYLTAHRGELRVQPGPTEKRTDGPDWTSRVKGAYIRSLCYRVTTEEQNLETGTESCHPKTGNGRMMNFHGRITWFIF